MRHRDSHDWPWHPDLQAVFDGLGLIWKVLPPGETLTEKTLGTSPGDTYYTGRTFVFEHLCPPEWVVHELAHWLVARARRPKDLRKKNYGFETRVNYGSEIRAEASVQADEDEASLLTCGLERFLSLGNYKVTADQLSLLQGVIDLGDKPYATLSDDDPVIVELARQVDEGSAPYLAGLP